MHELTYVLDAFPSIRLNADWLRKNICHFITCASAVVDNLVEYLKIEKEKTSVVYEFINYEGNKPDKVKVRQLKMELDIPPDAFVVGMCGTFEWRKSADLLPVLAVILCQSHDDIHFIWLGADKESQLYKSVQFDLTKAGLKKKVHILDIQINSRPFFHLFDVFLMTSREDPFPLVNLESGMAGKPVICFQHSGGTEEYVAKGTGHVVPYLDIKSFTGKILNYYDDRELLNRDSAVIPDIIRDNFTTEVQAPKIFEIINRYYDNEEMMLTEDPSITIMTHIFYDNSWEEIKLKLKHFDNGTNYFLFSVSDACLVKDFIIEDIKITFKNAYVLVTSNIGKDIGGKLALIDLYLMLGIHSSYIIFLHDKQSPQTLVGESWKNNLYKIIEPDNYKIILEILKKEKVGIVGAKEHIINEYNSITGQFRHNNDITKKLLQQYNISISNYDYLSGTMYWLKASIIDEFFTQHNPIALRKNLESGNVLDNYGDTVVHTWERMFCWIATNNGYSISGI